MDLEKMDKSIEEMEEITSSMRSIKDSYQLLEKTAKANDKLTKDIEKTRKELSDQAVDFKNIEKKIDKSNSEIYNVCDSISKEINTRLRDVSADMSKLKLDVNECLLKVNEEETEFKNKQLEQYQKINSRVAILFLISLISIVCNIVILVKVF